MIRDKGVPPALSLVLPVSFGFAPLFSPFSSCCVYNVGFSPISKGESHQNMLDIVIGRAKNVLGQKALIAAFANVQLHGTLYTGYPIIASADSMVVVDALLTCREHGVVVIDFLSSTSNEGVEAVRERQDDLYNAVQRKLLEYKPLVKGRELLVDVQVLTFVPSESTVSRFPDLIVAGPESLAGALQQFEAISSEALKLVNAAIQRVATIKPNVKRTNVTRENSRGAVMQKIEREIANLDQWQKKAAVESPDGPQRIRGLAGSGKTIVLALKAAYLHAANPDWDIAVTFNTRALYQQFRDFIRRFSFEHKKDEPDWSKLRILHAWGSSRQPGIYSEIASANDQPIRDFVYAKSQFSSETGFEGICDELLKGITGGLPKALFDAVLIDEAQDLPRSFFELCYLSTRDPNRVVWAYDELQNLGSYSMAPPSELFGKRSNGQPNVPNLDSGEGMPRRDIVLPVCYRNTPWALTTAHAVGFGVYRKDGLVQFFEDTGLWEDIGYRVRSGALRPGERVELERDSNSYPQYFADLLNPVDAVQWMSFSSAQAQAEWLAGEINRNLTEDELKHTDILVVLPNAVTSKTDAGIIIEQLERYSIPAHLAGVMTSVDRLYQDGSIAISGIYRAKGNEAPMVYILNAEYALRQFGTVRARNALFTGITRSRAWVRIVGCGPNMDAFVTELQSVRNHQYRLDFIAPTEQQLARMRRIHRDLSDEEIAKQRNAVKNLEQVFQMLESGELAPEALPENLRKKFVDFLERRDDT
jgi:superfamily I DNA and RNA helicase